MDNTLTLNKINKSDVEVVGYKAVDLAELHKKKLNIPICFVIKSTLFDDFVSGNNLNSQINRIISESDFSNDESLEAAYTKIKELFDKTEFSQQSQDELMEAYETLAIDIDHLDIAKLVTTIDKPYLTVIGSPNYVDDSENNNSIIQNVKGKPALFKAIKSCWSSLYTPAALKYRKKEDITTEEKIGVIVQRMTEADVSAQTFSDKTSIVVKTFYGYQDYEEEFEKDVSVFDKDTLAVKNTKINNQEFFFVRHMRDNNLTKKDLREKGDVQKLNDKDIEELARITKKVEGLIEKPVKLFISITKNKIYLLFVNRILIKEKDEEITEELITETSIATSKPEEKVPDKVPPEIDSIDLADDLSVLDEIEAHELEKNVVVEPPKEKKEKSTSWTEDTAEEETDEETIEQEESSWAEPVSEEEEISKPDVEEAIEEKEDSDDFIFSHFEEKKKNKPSPEEKVSDIPIPKPDAEEKDQLDEAVEMTKKIVIKSYEAIYGALKKKHLEVVNSKPHSFEKAIKGLQESSVRIPFLEEIKNVYEIKLKIEMGEDTDIEESTIALRTAKNFLGMFS
ncbi:MAG: PEP/pyruvate-binding domain-containing protein [archaeon]